MFFKNIAIFRLPAKEIDTVILRDNLFAKSMAPCLPSDMQSIGWVSPRNDGQMAHFVNRQILVALGVEQKLLPASVVKQFANDKAKAIEETEGRRVGRKEMRELREAMTLELLPRAFIRRRTTFGWIDPVNGWLAIDTPSLPRAEEFLEYLRKTWEGFPAKVLHVSQAPTAAMTAWVAEGEAPGRFTVDQDLNLSSAERAQVRYVKHSLEGEDIRHQIAEGKVATKLAMTWSDKISFVLDENLQIKRLAFLDILKEQADGQAENEKERFDIDFMLMTGELSLLLNDLVSALGGELVRS